MEDRFKVRAWDEISKQLLYIGIPIGNRTLLFNESGKLFVSEKYLVGVATGIRVAKSKLIRNQCIGLEDNKNKLIYESDIIENINTKEKYLIEWESVSCSFFPFNKNVSNPSSGIEQIGSLIGLKKIDSKNYKIIGNKFKNPELFEE